MYPILFTIPGIHLPIYSYGVMLGISLIVGWYVVLGLGRRDGLSREWMSSCYIWTAVFAIVGARILYIVTNPSEFQDPVKILQFREGGLVAYGGFLGGTLGSWWTARRQRKNPNVSFLAWADAVVPSLATGLLFTRIGCLLYGCDFGARVGGHAPKWLQAVAIKFPNWATRFPSLAEKYRGGSGCSGPLHGSPAWNWHVEHYGLSPDARWSYAVHPTQIYESLVGLGLFAILMLVRWKWRRFTGQLFLLFVGMYGVIRALLETVRDDPERGGWLSLSTSQLIGIGTTLAAGFFYYRLRRRALADPEHAIWKGPPVDLAPAAEPSAPKRRRPGRRR
jgi:phosphatidylglycerol:prolipoprotein diacylglycerol transferase